jgi:hypothetical protein
MLTFQSQLGNSVKEVGMTGPGHFMPVFAELAEECLTTVKLIEALKAKGLLEDRKDELLGDLSVAITSLKIKTDILDEELAGIENIVL